MLSEYYAIAFNNERYVCGVTKTELLQMLNIKTIFFAIVLSLIAGHSKAQQWVNRFNGQGDFSDKFNAITTDATGNVFLAGYTVNPGTSRDLLLVKLDPLGDTVWTSIYNGIGNGADEALTLTLDASGNIYTTGYQKGPGTGNDFITIKYNAAGVILWTATYNYFSNESDQSNSIVVDASGNVFIAGQSDSDPSLNNNDDYVVIKYNAAGATDWAVRTNGFGNGTDQPTKILLDPTGNIVVTGRAFNGFDDDYMTVKYDPAGTVIWNQLFDRLHYDRATDMAINPNNGNIYVTGRSGNGNDYDYATVCYNSTGVQQWFSIYDNVDDDRATFVALDGTGNIYVTGQSDANPSNLFNYNITTVKYNTNGNQQWVRNWSGSAGNDDSPGGFYVNNAGDVFVTGQSDTDPTANVSNDIVVAKYNTGGTLQWANTYNRSGSNNDAAFGIIEDVFGNVIVAGYSENIPQKDAVAIKYNSTGVNQWTKFYNGIGDNSDNSHAIVVDAADNVYTAGYTVGYNTDKNFAVLKVDASGVLQWEKDFNGSSTLSIDDAQALALDANGNICVAGYTKNSGTSSDITVVKLNPLGDTLWFRTYNYDLANESDKAFAIATDAANNIYVTGRSDSDPTINNNDDIVTIKYNTNGLLQWVVRYNGVGNGSDGARAIKVTPAGNVYVGGRTYNGVDEDYVLIKYNNLGIQQWVSTYNGGFGNDESVAMAMDASENLFITGFSENNTALNTDMAVVGFNAAGSQLWAQRFDGSANGNDDGKGIAVDNAGNVIVTGTTDTDTSVATLNGNIFVVKYDAAGNQQWINFYDGPANANDDASDVAIGSANSVIISGQADFGSVGLQNYDFATIQYSASGQAAPITNYNGTGNASDVANTLVTKNNFVYVTGGSYGATSQRDLVTIKYDIIPLGVTENLIDAGIGIYPNPCSEFTKIHFSKDYAINIQTDLVVIDAAGREILKDYTINAPELTLKTKNLKSGVYTLKISQLNKVSQYSKLIIF